MGKGWGKRNGDVLIMSTCEPFYLTAAPLGYSLFTPPSSPLRESRKEGDGERREEASEMRHSAGGGGESGTE